MTRKIHVTLAATLVAIMIGVAHAATPTVNSLSPMEVNEMIRSAHTAQEYRALAGYFRSRQQSFEQKAASEKQEFDRRSQNISGPSAKYPRPVDSSRNRYEYFTYEAAQMKQEAVHFEVLMANAQQSPDARR